MKFVYNVNETFFCKKLHSERDQMHSLLQIKSFEEIVTERDSLLSTVRAKLITLQADHSASGDAVSGLEALLADKDKQIER
jgi:hypothetical protein